MPSTSAISAVEIDLIHKGIKTDFLCYHVFYIFGSVEIDLIHKGIKTIINIFNKLQPQLK